MIVAPKRLATLKSLYGKEQDRYMELILRFPLRPIETEEDLDRAIKVIDSIIDLGGEDDLKKAEKDYLYVLSDLVEAYEAIHYPEVDVPDAAMLQSLIEARDVTQAEVAKGAGIAVSTVSEVLSGKRQLTRAQIGKISRYFKVDPGVFSFDR